MVLLKILEEKAINNSRKSIKDLLDIKEPFAQLVDGKKIVKIPVEEVKKDDVLVVKKGEKVPVDGVIISFIILNFLNDTHLLFILI